MKKFINGLMVVLVGGLICCLAHSNKPKEKYISVQDVVDIIETSEYDYIVKDTNTWALLKADEYMDREIEEIAICDDTENTLCLFIQLGHNEPVIVDIVEE